METKMGKLVVVRHAESEWNRLGLFTGKQDVHLSSAGFEMSNNMGTLIRDIHLEKIFTSMQVRAIETQVCMMNSKGQYCPEVTHSSALNERDYGIYTGINKKEKELEMGVNTITALRRGWDFPVPEGETLKMVYERVIPFFKQEILPILKQDKNVLIVSHGNTTRALMKYLEDISDVEIESIEMPFNEILIYNVNESGKSIKKEIRKVDIVVNEAPNTNEHSLIKIIATIGPASEKPEMLNQMMRMGMDIARLNFFWGKIEEQKKRIETIKEVAKNNKKKIPIIIDLPGPRIQDQDGHTYDKNLSNRMTPEDQKFIEFGVQNEVDYFAVSFVGTKEDIVECKREIQKHGGNQKVMAKIERKDAVDNLDQILTEADAIMIARGDLANEVALEKIPFVQDEIVKKCKKAGKPVVVATQLLYTMKDYPIPTRAEATDVITAVLQGTDATMLSEETAQGKYPIKAVYVMEKMLLEAEKHLHDPKFNPF